MFGLGKNKKAADAGLAPEVAQAMRTMTDDLAGVPVATNTETLPPEPPVSFQPDPDKGAPFFTTAPETSTNTASESPFLGDVPPQAASVSTAPTSETPVSAAEMEAPNSVWNTPPSSEVQVERAPAMPIPGSRKKILIFGGVGLVILALIGGGMYFFVSRSTETPDGAEGTGVVQSPAAVPGGVQVAVPPTVPIDLPGMPTTARYSATQPNFFSLNTETVTAESLRTELLKTAAEVKDSQLAGAVEFLVRDQNYNPLAFSRFVYLAKIELPDTLLTQIDEAFSLYIFVDQSRPRLGLAVTLKDPALFQQELTKAEKSLPQAINPLFLDTTTAPKANLNFRSGAYGGLPTRFANVDSTLNLSVDYANRNREWLVGTSKDTLRAMIDKRSSAVAPTTPQ